MAKAPPAPAPEPEAMEPLHLVLSVTDRPDGTSIVRGAVDGGEFHTITMLSQHAALAAFREAAKSWLNTLGERSMSWERVMEGENGQASG